MKKRLIVVGVILFSILAILGLYQTFALSGVITTTDNEYNFSIIDENTIEVPAKKSKTIYYKTTNTNKGKVKYGIGYTGSNIKVKYFADTIDPVTGLINYGETKFIKLKLINNSTTNTNVVLNTILGYEKGGDLIVPNGMTLVTEKIDASNIIQMSEEATSESSTFLGSSLMRSSINSITIASDNIVPTTAIGSIEVSKNKDGTVMMWWFNSSTSNMYDVFIGSESGITSAYNCYKMFSWLTNLKTIDLTYLDTSTVSDMSYMFFKTSSIETLDLTSLNTTNVTNMKAMFSGCMQLKNVDVSNFNTLKVTSMIDMFCNCQAIKTLDLSSFVTSNVTSMSGMFYQNYNLIDYMTPLENLKIVNPKADKTILNELGLKDDEIKRNVLKLSGGQQQRVAIARTLVANSPVILADEPTGNLDSDTEEEIIEILKTSAHKHGKCVIVVTHSKDLASKSDVILELKDKKLVL